MNPFEIEKLRLESIPIIGSFQGTPKVLAIYSFYNALFETKDDNLINSFAIEFIDEYLQELKNYSPFYSHPNRTYEIIDQLNKFISVLSLVPYYNAINERIDFLTIKLNHFIKLLEGSNELSENKKELLFPLIGEIVTPVEHIVYSTAEKIKIKIAPSKEKDSFIFIPSPHKKEEIEEQAKTSFLLAKEYLDKYKNKFKKHHEILIYFNYLNADYKGKSLGIALTIGFIEQLTHFYNLPYIINIKSNVASTGSVNINGNLIPFGKEIISKKVEAIFYSDINNFIVPKEDEQFAKDKISELKKSFPKRELNIVAVENLHDIFNRRNLVDIKKQSPLIRTTKSIKKSPFTSLLLLFLLLLFAFVYAREFDDNPYAYDIDGSFLVIKNKSGKILHYLNSSIDNNVYIKSGLKSYIKILDVNNDGSNEIIIATIILYSEDFDSKIVCRDKYFNILWQYTFKDSISSDLESLKPIYNHELVDTCTINSKKYLVCSSDNGPSYSAAIYFLDLKTGKREGTTFWNPGHITEGLITDFNSDNKKELIFLSANNGYEKNALGILPIDKIIGQAPTTKKYLFHNLDIADFIYYATFENTDYFKLQNKRILHTRVGHLQIIPKEKIIQFPLFNEMTPYFGAGFGVELSTNLMDYSIVIHSDFRVLRDTLVAHGKLKPPLTDTPEYCNLLISQIRVWDGKKFVTVEEYKKKRAPK